MAKSRWFKQLLVSLRGRFDLTSDGATQQEVIDNIGKGVVFSGTNLWVLICATFIASLGLTVNSAAVIIGAMLISPLMGPIMGCGLALGINDLELMKRSLRNLGFMIVTAIVSATLFFLIIPVGSAQSELLARTTPTTYDVLIALFGGAAGVIAQTRRDRTSTVIPGVAIATALMPPLCTAGFGLATLQLNYFIGAAYLFFINMACIALSAYAVVRMLKYHRYELADPSAEHRVKVYMTIILLITIVPSSIMFYRIVRKDMFMTSADNYVENVFKFNGTRVLETTKTFHMGRRNPSVIDVELYGEPVSDEIIDNAREQMQAYNLKNTKLIVRQASTGNTKIDFSSVQKSYSELLTEKNERIRELQHELNGYKALDTLSMRDLTRECSAIVGNVERVSMSRQVVYSPKGEGVDTILVCVIKPVRQMTSTDRERLERWLTVRGKTDKIHIYVE